MGAILALVGSPLAAGPFQNLDFESANVSPGTSQPSDPLPVSDVFPGWTLKFNNDVQDQAHYDYFVLDYDDAAVIDTQYGYLNVIEGQHSALLSSGVARKFLVSLSQQGDVPAASRSLRFVAENPFYPDQQRFPGPFDVRINDQPVNLVTLSQNAGRFDLGVDVTAFAGQTVTLQIGVVAAPNDSGSEGFALLDSIAFSSVAIPEPGAICLVTAGLLAVRRRARRRC